MATQVAPAPPIGLAEPARSARLDRRSRSGNPLRRLLAFIGPGYLVAVGYMDPGNWATDLAGGSAFGYTLLCGRADLQPDGDPAPVAVRAARHRHRPRPRPGLPRALSRPPVNFALWVLVRARDHRLRPRRGDRHRDRACNCCSAFRWLSGRAAHRARRAADPAAAAARLPLARGVHHQPDHGDRRLLRDRDVLAEPDCGRRRRRLRPAAARSSPTRRCSTSRSASSARR